MTGRFSRKEAAERLHKAPNTLYRWEASKKSPVRPKKVLRTGEVFYTEEDIQALIAWMDAVEDSSDGPVK